MLRCQLPPPCLPDFYRQIASSLWAMERYVNLECGRCGERLYTDLCDFKETDGSQPHLKKEIYTNQAPDNLMSLTDVKINSLERCSFNCSRNCHNPLFLIDAGTGVVDRGGYKYALACGDQYVQILEALWRVTFWWQERAAIFSQVTWAIRPKRTKDCIDYQQNLDWGKPAKKNFVCQMRLDFQICLGLWLSIAILW